MQRVVFLFDLSCVRNPEREKKKIPAMNHNLATPAEANPAIFRPGPFCPSYYWTAQVGESSRRPPIRFITCPSACLFFLFLPVWTTTWTSEARKRPLLYQRTAGEDGPTVNVITGSERGSDITPWCASPLNYGGAETQM